MKRFALLIVLQGYGILAFSQSPATNLGPPKSLPLKTLSEMDGRQRAEITPPTRLWVGPLPGLKSAQNPTSTTGDVNQFLQVPTMNAGTIFGPLRPSASTLPAALPIAKLEPIPTQWPNAKLEQIPTKWPNLKLQQKTAESS